MECPGSWIENVKGRGEEEGRVRKKEGEIMRKNMREGEGEKLRCGKRGRKRKIGRQGKREGDGDSWRNWDRERGVKEIGGEEERERNTERK
jgi:hypothetical protein